MTESERLGLAERIDRHRARAWLLQIHYRWESASFDGSLRDALVDTVATRRVSPRRLPYIRSVLTLLEEHLGEVDAKVSSALDNWRLERVGKIDRAILRIGAVEILYIEEVPPKVSIQEAIQLAEAYGGEDSPGFVNGVLDALFKGHEGVPS